MDDIRDQLPPPIGREYSMGTRNLILSDGDASMLVEDVDEGSEVGQRDQEWYNHEEAEANGETK